MTRAPRVLVVEDNEANQLLTRYVLELDGFELEVAGSAAEAREKLEHMVPDLILMDIQLPGQDGLSFTTDLKRASETAAIPVVALTAHAMRVHEEQAIAAGCAGFISKPINTKTFGEQVRTFLSGARPADGAAAVR